MRILVISDLHGDLGAAWRAVNAANAEVLLCCGDWGDPGELDLPRLEEFSRRLPVYTVYGNHDDLDALRNWSNEDGSPVLLANGTRRPVGALTLVGINGIWAKSHRKPYYVTDDEVVDAAQQAAESGPPVDILLTHGCPSGVADLTADNRHGGQRCFLRAFQTLRPRVYLTGHLHRAQEHRTREGQVVRNVGQTPRGDATVIKIDGNSISVEPLHFRTE